MKTRRLWIGICASMGMLILILDGRTALEGARQGIALCLKTVVPSLFPFFLLSIVLTNSFMGCSLPVLRPLGWLCRIPRGAESILIAGFLGGYPAGAQNISAAYEAGQLEKAVAERLLAFCSNAGPAFLFGIVAAMFPRKRMAWVLWGIHIASAVLVSLVIPGTEAQAVKLSSGKPLSPSSALSAAIRVMAAVCGWVVLFRIVIAFLSRWVLWLLPEAVQVAVIGLLELSNGCCQLLSVPQLSLRFLICAGILAFGGLCVTMQTMSVTNGLSLRYYIWGKVLQTVFSLIMAGAVITGMGLPCCIGVLFCALLLRKKQKKSSIQPAVGV